jgi:glycosyltransferase involved in cell wall biosynthesis
MSRPKISIITVTYNCKEQLPDTIESIISQTYTDIEYILVDGMSTDGTLEVINQYKSKINKVISEPDKGIFDAMNKGIDLSSGEWIIFMNAGDRFSDSEVLSNIFLIDRKANEYGVIFGDYILLSKDNRSIYKKATPFFESKKKIKKMGFNHQSIFVRSDYAKSLKFDINFKVAADYNMINSLFKQGVPFKYINQAISVCEEFGFSNNFKKIQIREITEICALPSYYYYYQLASSSLFKFKSSIGKLLSPIY